MHTLTFYCIILNLIQSLLTSCWCVQKLLNEKQTVKTTIRRRRRLTYNNTVCSVCILVRKRRVNTVCMHVVDCALCTTVIPKISQFKQPKMDFEGCNRINPHLDGAVKRDLRTYVNSENPDQPVHARSLVRIFAAHLHNIGTLMKIQNW